MKKVTILILAILSLAFVSAEAKVKPASTPRPGTCPYTDTISFAGNTGAVITGLSSTGNLVATEISPTAFTTGCANNSIYDGDALVKVASATGTCSVDVVDGPFENSPYVNNNNSSCQGNLHIGGIVSNGGYSYSLTFYNA